LECGERHELDEILPAFAKDETLPDCKNCGSQYIKTATISFGQPMPEDAMRLAEVETMMADLFVSIGSSLVVYPAAGFPLIAKKNGATLVILNRDPTELDQFADLVINDEIGYVMGDAVGVN
jgi:NAD-dependent deacetylase